MEAKSSEEIKTGYELESKKNHVIRDKPIKM